MKEDVMKKALAQSRKDYSKMSDGEIRQMLLEWALSGSGDRKTQVASCVILKDGRMLFGVNHLGANHNLTVEEITNRTTEFYKKMICSETDMVNKAEEMMINLSGAKIYSLMFPCPRCAKKLSECGVKHVKAFYCKVKRNGNFIDPLKTSEDIFKSAGVTYEIGEPRD